LQIRIGRFFVSTLALIFAVLTFAFLPPASFAAISALPQPGYPDVFTDMAKMPAVTLDMHAESRDADANRIVIVTLHNPTQNLAVMAHVQLRRKTSGERVLPVYYSDNYISLTPNETRTITIEAAVKEFNDEDALVMLDGWNTTVAPSTANGVGIAPNVDAQPDHQPFTGLPFQTTGLR